MDAFNKNGLRLQFTCEREDGNPEATVINMKATNSTTLPIYDFVFQAAVPKVRRLIISNSVYSGHHAVGFQHAL